MSTEPTDWFYAPENGRLAHGYLAQWESLNGGVTPEQWGDMASFVDLFNNGDVDAYTDQYASDGGRLWAGDPQRLITLCP